MLNVEAAREELSNKSYHDVQVETAWKWASRACAAYEWVSDKSSHALISWTVAEEYCHEAIEHAALSGSDAPELLKEIQDAIEPYQEVAVEYLDSKFKQDMSKEV